MSSVANGESGLVAFRCADGRVVCVDCDIYPSGATDVRKENADAEARCSSCGAWLTDVFPVSGAAS